MLLKSMNDLLEKKKSWFKIEGLIILALSIIIPLYIGFIYFDTGSVDFESPILRLLIISFFLLIVINVIIYLQMNSKIKQVQERKYSDEEIKIIIKDLDRYIMISILIYWIVVFLFFFLLK